jgi:hypothetical protein
MGQFSTTAHSNGSDYECQVSEQEIRAALAALRSAPPICRQPPEPSAPTASLSAKPWVVGLLGIVLGVILGITLATKYQSGQTQVPATNPQPMSLRALPVSPPVPQREIGSRQVLTLLDGTTLPTVFKGYLPDVSKLPLHGSKIGDMYGVGGNLWVLSTIPNTSRVGWVDPPEASHLDQGSPDNVEVRRAKKLPGY